MKVTDDDYYRFDWFDRRQKPDFILVIIEDPDSGKQWRLVGWNLPLRSAITATMLSIEST